MVSEKAKSGIFLDLVKKIMLSYGLYVALLILVFGLSIIHPRFLSYVNIRNIFMQVSIIGVLSIGMTYVIISGEIDLSVGSVLALGGVIGAGLSTTSIGEAYPLFIWLPGGLLAGLVAGILNGYFVAKWKIASFVVTLGMLSMARGATYLYTDGMPVPNLPPELLGIARFSIAGYIPLLVLIFIGLIVLSWIILTKTSYGRYVYAVGGNEEAAKISGVNVDRIKISVFAIAGLLSALGGIMMAARTSAALPTAGRAYELDAIAAVVIGGTSLTGGRGTIIGTLIGVLIMGVVNNGLNLMGVSPYFQEVFKGAIIILAVLLDSLRKRQGLQN